MKKSSRTRWIFLACLLSLPLAGAITPLQFLQIIPLAHVEGRIDHLSVDVKGKRLFVSALGNGTVEVIDLQTGKTERSIRGLKEPQGVYYVSELDRLFVASAGDGTCRVLNGETFEQIETVALASDADNVRYDAAKKQIYVGYGSGALAVIDVTTNLHLGDIRLPAHPESFQLEKSGPRIYVNVPEAGGLFVVDRDRRSVVEKWSLGNARANFPMALDETDHRLFVACRRPAELLVYNTTAGKIVAQMPIVADCDDLFYDSIHKRIYASGGEGYLSVVDMNDPDHYTVTAKLPTAAGARTSLFVPELGRLYVAVPHRGSQAAELHVYEAR